MINNILDNNQAINLSIAIISTVFIVGLMAAYVQIMNRLVDKEDKLKLEFNPAYVSDKEYEKIYNTLKKISCCLDLLTIQILLFFSSLFLLIYITIRLLFSFKNETNIFSLSIIFVLLLAASQIFHLIVFLKSYHKYIWKEFKRKNPFNEEILIYRPLIRRVCSLIKTRFFDC